MAQSASAGPHLVLGGFMGGPGGSQPREYSDEIGPSIFWGGVGFPAPGPGSKDKKGSGAIPALSGAYPIRTVNAFIQPGGATATVTAATAPVANTPILPLTAYAAGRAPCPQMFGGVSVNAMAVDMGIETVTFATAGTVTMAAPSLNGNVWRYNKPGLWLALLGGGLPAGASMFTQVVSVNPATGVINVSPAPAVSGPGQIGLTNRFNPNLYGAGPPSGLSSEASAGAARISIPEIGNTRGLGIVAVGVGLATSYLLQGIDGYGSPQSEIVAVASAAGTYWSKKTYDVFINLTPLSADTGRTTVQVIVSDFIGLPLSVLSNNGIQQVLYGVPGAQTAQIPVPYATSNYTVIPADTTFPATQTTGDPRGGIQVSGNGPAVALGLTAPASGITLVGTSLLTIQQILDPLAVALATSVNPGPLLGVPAA